MLFSIGFLTYGSVTMKDRSYLIVGADSDFAVRGGSFRMIGTGGDEEDEFGFPIGAFIIGTERSLIEVDGGSLSLENAMDLSLLEGAVTIDGGDMVIAHRSRIFATGGIIKLKSGSMIFHNTSTMAIYDRTLFEIGGNFEVSNSSSLFSRNSLIEVRGNVVMSHASNFSTVNTTLRILGGSVIVSDDSCFILSQNSTILGTGSILGRVSIESGSISYSSSGNGSIITPTNLTITDLKASNESNFGLIITTGDAGQFLTSTFVNATFVDLGGNIVIIIDGSIDEYLRSGSLEALFPFLTSATPINGAFSNITITIRNSVAQIDYSSCYKVSQSTSRTLSVLFDPTAMGGKCGTVTHPSQGSQSDESQSQETQEPRNTIAVVIGVTFAVIVAIVAILIVLFVKIPSLRRKFLPALEASHEMKTLKSKLIGSQDAAPAKITEAAQKSSSWRLGQKPLLDSSEDSS